MIDSAAQTFMWFGVIFILVGSIGALRFEDVYLRLHASTKTLTFGLGFLVTGAGLASGDPATFAKALLIVFFQFITAPIAAQMIARAALRTGVMPEKLARIDTLNGEYEEPAKTQ